MAGSGSTAALKRLADFRRDESAATAIEYALIAVGISIAISVTVFGIGKTLLAGYYDRLAAAFGGGST